MNSHGSVKKKKVLILTTVPETIESFYITLAKELSRSFEVSLAASFDKELDGISFFGFRIVRIPLKRNPFKVTNITSIFILAKHLRREKISIIIMSTPVAAFVGRIAAVLARVPIRIVDVRGLFPKKGFYPQYLLYNAVERMLCRITTWYNFVNPYDMHEFYDKGYLKKGKYTTLGCGGSGVDIDKFSPQRVNREKISKLKEEFNISENDFVLLFAGRLTKDKGVFDFIELVSLLSKEEINVKGLIAGAALADESRVIRPEDIIEKCAELGVLENVVYIGYREDMPEILSLSDILVLPSKREGFGLVLAEAAAMGVPSIAYDNRGSRIAIVDGENGFIVPQGDIQKMANLVKILRANPVKMEEMGKRARRYVCLNFCEKIITEKYASAVISLCREVD